MIHTVAAFIGCPWCHLRVFGCRCATACGAPHCDGEIVFRTPATIGRTQPDHD